MVSHWDTLVFEQPFDDRGGARGRGREEVRDKKSKKKGEGMGTEIDRFTEIGQCKVVDVSQTMRVP